MSTFAFSKLTRPALALTAASLAAFTFAACSSSDSDSDAGTTAAAASGSDDTLVLVAVPAENAQSLENSYASIIEVLEEATGKTIEFQNASDYAAVIEGQRAGQIDLAAYGPFSYIISHDGGVNNEPLGAPITAQGGETGYTSRAYVRADSDITSLADLSGRTVCFVDPASTSGYLVPSEGLLDAGVSPTEDVEAIFAGGHDASLLALDSGQCDAAFALDAMADTLDSSGQLNKDDLTQIWESATIPDGPITVNLDTVDAETVEKLRDAVINKANRTAMVEAGLCASEEDCTLPENKNWGYTEITDADYDYIRSICEKTQAEACSSVG